MKKSPLGLVAFAVIVSLGFGIAGCASQPKPAKAQTREWRSAKDSANEILQCLRKAGIDADIRAEAVGGEFPADKRSIVEKCNDVGPMKPMPKKLMKAYYQYAVEQAACLRGEGFDVPQDPTYETFRENWETSKDWTPANAVFSASLTEDERDRILKKCPSPGFRL